MSIDRKKISWNGWGWTAHKDDVAANEAAWSWLADELGMPSLLATPARPLDDIALAPSRLSPSERAHFAQILGEDRVRDDHFERAFHARGRSYHDLLHLRAGNLSTAPDAVLYPRGTEEVLSVLSFASDNGIAIVPFGGGTSVVGSVTGTAEDFKAAVSLDMSGTDRLIGIDGKSETATAEAGIYGPTLDKALRAQNVVLGHYPQSFEFSTLGGWIAHRGAGQQSSRYGRANDWLVSAKLATPRGLLVTEDFPASSAGPRLTDLILGSEGAFGVITEATVHVQPAPEASVYTGFLFHDFANGAAAIRKAVQEGVPAAMLRLSDAEETRFYRAYGAAGKRKSFGSRIADAILHYRKFGDTAVAMIAGFEGDAATVERSRKRFSEIAKQFGAMAIGDSAGKRWHQGRFHGPYLREPMMDRGLGVDTLETATSWSKIDALYAAVKSALENTIRETAPRPGARGIVACHISHSYPNGASLYFTYIFPRALDGDVAQWLAIKRAATDAIVAHGGTISHHHGVGEDHLPWIVQEKGALGVDVLRAIKTALDPKGILNPGKLIPS
ncbi:MAG: FAD-binding oxidoreductase [Proteobacteria bacterium]|nr:FAD-binding oxidoreductase [Pseudomonadota bacterium]